MSNKINVCVHRNVSQSGQYSFSTNHDTDLVDKWLDDGESDCWEGRIDYWDNTCLENSTIEDTDVYEGEGDDNCPYDDDIQKWKDEYSIDMNLIFEVDVKSRK